MKLFELTTNTRLKFGSTLTQIRATVDFKTVKAGDLGGWIEDEKSISDDCWIYPEGCVFKHAKIHGGEMYGGVMYGGVMYGGVMYGGVMYGGVMYGGEMYGGEMRGGVMRGGVMRGGVMEEDNHIGFANVGSENGYLLAYIDDNRIMISRGCFHGTIDEFYQAVEQTHDDNEHAVFYKSIRPIIEMKLSKFTGVNDE